MEAKKLLLVGWDTPIYKKLEINNNNIDFGLVSEDTCSTAYWY